MTIFFKDEILVNEDGSKLCKVTRDVFSGDIAELAHFTEWTIEAPKAGDKVHPRLMQIAKERLS